MDPDAGDYHITEGSAARDAGVNAGVTTDIDGQARPQGAGYDIGADEWHPAAAECREDVNGDGVINIVDIMTVVTHWRETCP